METQDKFCVLVIEDSPEIRDFLVEGILKHHDFETFVAVDGADGLKKALNLNPDLILMDYELPKMSGLQILRKLRSENYKTPVILMTSHGSEQLAVEVFRLGVEDYLMKPFKPSDMLDAIENALSVSHLEREKEALTFRVVKTNHELEQRLYELNALYSVGKSITALMEPDVVLDRIVEAVLFMTKSEACTLFVVESDTQQLRKRIKKYRKQKHTTSPRKRHSTEELRLMATSSNGKVSQGPEGLLFVPLKMGERLVGKLSIQKQVRAEFTSHDEKLLRMLADYAAIALHNLELLHQLHLTKEREKNQIRGMFERYVAPTVVEQVLTQPGKVELGGTRRAITVLFADVRGFSTFSAKTSPEILVQLLNQYMRVAADAVLAQQGTLDKFMGDAVMAFFNAPLTQTNHPLRAIKAAWNLRQSVKKLHRYLPSSHQLHFGVGVGVGEAVVGNIGTPQMMNYTVIGDSVNKVKRLQENAEGGQILISQETYDLVQDFVEARCLGNLHLKGQSHPEPVYEVVGLLETKTNRLNLRQLEAVPLLGA